MCFFFGIFFKRTDELSFALEFIRKNFGKYDYFSRQVFFNRFPLSEHLNSLFFGDEPPLISEKYGYKMLSPYKTFSINKIPEMVKKIKKFQKILKKTESAACPILFGYLFHRQIILVYSKRATFAINDSSGFHSKVELVFSQNSFQNDANTIPLFQRKDILVFFNDLMRLFTLRGSGSRGISPRETRYRQSGIYDL